MAFPPSGSPSILSAIKSYSFICYLCSLPFPEEYRMPHDKIPVCVTCMEKVNRLKEAHRG